MKESYIKKLYSARVLPGKQKKPESGNLSGLAEIDLSLEEPDAMPDLFIIDTLYREASKWENRGNCIQSEEELNRCAGRYMEDFFGVPKLGEEEVSATGGMAQAFNLLSMAFINRGDAALITKPSVSTLEVMTRWLDGAVIDVPLPHKNKFYPKYEEIPQKSLKKAKLLYINYPGNPTGQNATYDFFKETVAFARLNNLVVLHDASFAALPHEEGKQLSILVVPEAKKVCAEVHSLCHCFNMAGWRIGFVAGNKNIIRAYNDIKSRCWAGQYAPARRAAAYALSHTEISIRNAKKYERRVSAIVSELERLGFKVRKPKAGFYIFVKAPKGTECGLKFNESQDFTDFLIGRGIRARAFEEGYVRFSVTFPALGEEEEKSVAEGFYSRLKDYKFIF